MEQQSLTLRDYLKVVFRQKSVILVCVATFMVTVLVGLQFKTPQYEATVKMSVSGEKQTESPYYRDLLAYQQVQVTLTQSEIVMSNPVLERAAQALELEKKPLDYELHFASGLKSRFIGRFSRQAQEKLKLLPAADQEAFLFRKAVEDLREALKVEPIRDTNLFTITARDYSPLGAAIIANAVSRSYQIFDLQQQLAELQLKYGEEHQIVVQLKDNIRRMIRNLSGKPLSDIDAIGPASVKIIEQASVPLKPSGPPKFLIVALAFFASVFLGLMLAFMFEYMDQSLKTPHDVEASLGVPFLGYVVRNRIFDSALVKPAGARMSAYGKTCLTLAEQLYLVAKNRAMKSVLFVSTMPFEGTSRVVANLAIMLSAKLRHKVLIIDANLRHPSQKKLFGTAGKGGLAEVLERKLSIDEVVVSVDERLSIVEAGQTQLNPITLLDSPVMGEVLGAARHKYEYVLVDGAALRDYKDSYMLAQATDGIVLVVSEGKIRRQVVSSALAPLRPQQSKVVGAVLNNRTYPIPRAIYEMV